MEYRGEDQTEIPHNLAECLTKSNNLPIPAGTRGDNAGNTGAQEPENPRSFQHEALMKRSPPGLLINILGDLARSRPYSVRLSVRWANQHRTCRSSSTIRALCAQARLHGAALQVAFLVQMQGHSSADGDDYRADSQHSGSDKRQVRRILKPCQHTANLLHDDAAVQHLP